MVNGQFFLLAFWASNTSHLALVRLKELNTVVHELVKIRHGFSQRVAVHLFTNLPSSVAWSSFARDRAQPKLWPSRLVYVVVAVAPNQLSVIFSKALPAGVEKQALWVRAAMLSSTKGLARVGVTSAAADEVMAILGTARDVSTKTHLREVFYLVDHRGSDVRIESGDILDVAAQAVPYPAPLWDWRTVPVFFFFLGLGLSRLVPVVDAVRVGLVVWSGGLFVCCGSVPRSRVISGIQSNT